MFVSACVQDCFKSPPEVSSPSEIATFNAFSYLEYSSYIDIAHT